MLILLSITKWFLWSPGMTLMDFANSSFDSFFAPANLNTFCFPSQGPLYCPRWSTFQGVSRSVDVILVRDFANSIDVLLVWQIFLVLESNLIFQRSCLFKSYWNEIKEMLIFEKTFWKSSFLIKDLTHVIRNIQSFDCHVFWKQNLTCCKTKMAFFLSWFFVSVLTFDLGYIFWRSAMRWPSVNFKKQKTQVKTWGFIKKDCFLFFAPILSACIITSSLIHEATTLMEKLFKFWERHLSVQIAYLIKKGF